MTKYNRLMEDLKKQIIDGIIKPGDKLPSENELSALYQVSRHTVRKGLAILEHEGYIGAEHGKGTFCLERERVKGDSKNIAVVTTYLSDYIFPRVIQGIDTVLTENGYSILLKNTRNSRHMERKNLEELLEKGIDGLIIEPSKSQIFCSHEQLYQKLEENGIPFVFIQGCFEQMRDYPKVLMDDCRGGYLATQYLLSLGHEKIVGIFKADDMQGRERHKGYVRALQEAGLRYEPDSVIWFHTEDRAIAPFSEIKRMAGQDRPMDAVVCYNDQIAIEVIKALNESGLKVPGDVSVTGYDNSFMAGENNGNLTTIAHPQEKLGEMAAGLLLKLIRKEASEEEKNLLIEPELVVRGSCREKII